MGSAPELRRGLTVGRPAVSEHLAVLRRAGLVCEEALGRQRLYYLDPRRLAEVEDWIRDFHLYWRQRRDAIAYLRRKQAKGR